MPEAKADLPREALARQKPVASMVPCGTLTDLPRGLLARSERQQAEYLLNDHAESANILSDCAIKQAALTEWINQE